MSWSRISVTVNGTDVDAVGDRLDALGAVSVSIESGGGAPVLEPAPGAAPVWHAARVTALFPATDAVGALQERVRAALHPIDVGEILHVPLADEDWTDAWRQNAEPRCFGHGLWVLPHDAPQPAEARDVIRLDPGLAFGTGAHPTTALCLEWLAGAALEGRSVLDLGCGSGILAIGAAKRGAARVLAVDHDEQALQATRENAARNGVAGQIEVHAALPGEPVDVVLANILANTLVALAPAVTACTRARGDAVLSGILGEQVDAVWQAYRGEFVDPHTELRAEWARLSFRRAGGE